MKKDGIKKLMPILVAIVLLMSLFVSISTVPSQELRVQYDRTPILQIDGDSIFTPGDEIVVRVTDGTLTEDQTYTLTVNNTDTGDWGKLYHGSQKADSKGDISFETRVPGYELLGSDVIGEHTLCLWEGDPDDEEFVCEVDIEIGNYFIVKIFVDDEEVPHLYHNYTYSDTELEFRIYNYTGGNSDELADDFELTCQLFDPEGDAIAGYAAIDDIDNGIYNELDEFAFDYFDDDQNKETAYWLYVENNDDADQYSFAPIPIKYYFDKGDLQDTYQWGNDDIEFDCYFQEYLWDEDDEVNELIKVGSYGSTVAIFGMNYDGDYEMVDEDDAAASKGRFSLDFNPVEDEWPAGTYYVGTYFEDGSDFRINETFLLNIPDFISYASFEVLPDTSVEIEIEDPDEIIKDFNQTINVTISNLYDDDDNYLNEDMYLHFTGLDCWYDGDLYDDEDVVVLGDNDTLGTRWTEDEVYYEFTITFKETGTGTFIAKHPDDEDYYSDNDYDNFELDAVADITGEMDFTVVTPDNINVIIEDYPTMVYCEQAGIWQNDSDAAPTTTISVYGDSEDEPINASIEITGCGLDKTIDEEEEEEDLAEGYKEENGVYMIKLQPKRSGTLTFTITNGTDGYTATKDYTISGLDGIVTTSDGDDLEITVEKPETITLDMGVIFSLADVEIGLFDNEWGEIETIDAIEGDEDEPGEGQDGDFDFVLEEENVENVGYIVIVAEMLDRFCYDIIEIVPDHDLEVNVTDPSEDNYIFTVGIPTTIVLHVLAPNGDIAENIGSGDVIGEILDSEDEVLQTIEFDANGDDWEIIDEIFWFPGTLVITATNNSGENEHDGNITYEVDLATITYTPDTVTCGIEVEDVEITVTGTDANGDPLTDIEIFLNEFNSSGDVPVPPDNIVDLDQTSITLDEDGNATFMVEGTDNFAGKVNGTFEDFYDDALGNMTYGQLTIDFPNFEIVPSTISTEVTSADVTVTATDGEGEPIKGLNITFWNLAGVACIEVPEPEMTDEEGVAEFSIVPLSSGKANVTILHGLTWDDTGDYDFDEGVRTTSVLTVSRKTLDVDISPTQVYAGNTFTVTVKDEDGTLVDAYVTFNGNTEPTVDGVLTLTAPNPGGETYAYPLKVVAAGFPDFETTVLVIKTYQIKITGPSSVSGGEEFTVTVIAGGTALAGATVTFEGTEKTSDDNGKAKLTAPSKKGTYTITATFDDERYIDGTLDIKVTGGIPGFELITLVIALGVAFIILRRRRK